MDGTLPPPPPAFGDPADSYGGDISLANTGIYGPSAHHQHQQQQLPQYATQEGHPSQPPMFQQQPNPYGSSTHAGFQGLAHAASFSAGGAYGGGYGDVSGAAAGAPGSQGSFHIPYGPAEGAGTVHGGPEGTWYHGADAAAAGSGGEDAADTGGSLQAADPKKKRGFGTSLFSSLFSRGKKGAKHDDDHPEQVAGAGAHEAGSEPPMRETPAPRQLAPADRRRIATERRAATRAGAPLPSELGLVAHAGGAGGGATGTGAARTGSRRQLLSARGPAPKTAPGGPWATQVEEEQSGQRVQRRRLEPGSRVNAGGARRDDYGGTDADNATHGDSGGAADGDSDLGAADGMTAASSTGVAPSAHGYGYAAYRLHAGGSAAASVEDEGSGASTHGAAERGDQRAAAAWAAAGGISVHPSMRHPMATPPVGRGRGGDAAGPLPADFAGSPHGSIALSLSPSPGAPGTLGSPLRQHHYRGYGDPSPPGGGDGRGMRERYDSPATAGVPAGGGSPPGIAKGPAALLSAAAAAAGSRPPPQQRRSPGSAAALPSSGSPPASLRSPLQQATSPLGQARADRLAEALTSASAALDITARFAARRGVPAYAMRGPGASSSSGGRF
jgi:hypothetical protein